MTRDLPLRIAHLLASLAIGGKERTVADLCNAAPRYGQQPFVITFDMPAAETATIDVTPTEVIALDRRTGRRTLARNLASALCERRIDVLHAHGHIEAIHAADAVRESGIPTVVTLHVDWHSGWRWALPVARGLHRAGRIVAVSADLACRYRRLAGRSIDVVPTGVDLSRFGTAATPLNTRDAGVLTVGVAARFHPVKRYGDIYAAIERLTRQGVPVRLLVASAPEAASLRTSFPLADVRVLGAISDMPGFYASLDIFVLASDHEGTPLALLEAMASGVPCVATAVGGIPDLARGDEGDCMLLVPQRDPRALADAIARLATQPELARKLAARARRRVELFTLDAQAAAYATIYHSVTASARAL